MNGSGHRHVRRLIEGPLEYHDANSMFASNQEARGAGHGSLEP